MRPKPGLDIAAAIAAGRRRGAGEPARRKGPPQRHGSGLHPPPGSQIGPITPQQRQALVANSLVAGVYEKALDRESAYEKLMASRRRRWRCAGNAPASPRGACRRQLRLNRPKPAVVSWMGSKGCCLAAQARAAATTGSGQRQRQICRALHWLGRGPRDRAWCAGQFAWRGDAAPALSAALASSLRRVAGTARAPA